MSCTITIPVKTGESPAAIKSKMDTARTDHIKNCDECRTGFWIATPFGPINFGSTNKETRTHQLSDWAREK
jgi:hypothetical protein